MGLCFDNALDALKHGRLTEREYLKHCLAHFCGRRHARDKIRTRQFAIMNHSSIGESIRRAALNEQYTPLQDPEPLLHLFDQIIAKDPQGLERGISEYRTSHPSGPSLTQQLAVFAASKGNGKTLRFCVEAGASLEDRNVDRELGGSSKDTDAMDLLYEADWRSMRTSTAVLHGLTKQALCHDSEEMRWALNHGGQIDEEALEAIAWSSGASAGAVSVLIERQGLNLFVGTRFLRGAARYGEVDVVRVLLDAGADPNEYISSQAWDRGESPTLALLDAILMKKTEVVKLLLERGASVDGQVFGRSGGALGMAERGGDDTIVRLLKDAVDAKGKM